MEQEDVDRRVAAILDGAQDSAGSHARYIKELTQLCEVAGPDRVLRKSLMNAVLKVLVVFKREPCVERVVTFLVSFVSSCLFQVKGLAFPVFFMTQLLPYTKASKGSRDTELTKAVRFRSTQLVSGVLNGLSEETELKNNVWEMLEAHLVERASDKVPLIRIQAALGLSRLQDVEESANAASKAYLRLLSSDPNKEVRRTALTNLVTSKHTLTSILDRVRDSNAEVRAETFRLIGSNVRVKTLSIKQRVYLLQSGLRDREASVRKECIGMLLEWLKTQGASITSLLKSFDVANTSDEKIIEVMIESLLEHVEMDSIEWRKAAADDAITPELAVLWRVFIKFNREKGNFSAVETNLPETLIEFCELITAIVTETSSASGYILRQILQLAPMLDKSDEGGRRAIVGLLAEIAAENFVEEKDVEALVKAIYIFSFGMEDFLNHMNNAITRSREHLELFEREESTQLIEKQEARMVELKRLMGPAELRQFMKKLQQEDEEGDDNDVEALMKEGETKSKNFDDEDGKLDDLTTWKKELRVLITLKKNRKRVGMWSWARTMTLIQQIFAHSKISDLDPNHAPAAVIEALSTYIPKYVALALSNDHIQVRLAAMRALGGLATLEVKRNAIQHVELLYHALSNDEVDVQVEALKILFDLVLSAGFEVFGTSEEEEEIEDTDQIEENASSDHTAMRLDGEEVVEDSNGLVESVAFEKKSKKVNRAAKSGMKYVPRDYDFEPASAPYEYPQLSVFSVLYAFLQQRDNETLQTTAVEGFTKLLASKRVFCDKILANLLELLFDPDTCDNVTLQQSLSLFLPMFAFASFEHQQLVAKSFVKTLRRFLRADQDSSLAEAHVATYLRFILQLTDMGQLNEMHRQQRDASSGSAGNRKMNFFAKSEDSPTLHNLLAIDVCIELIVEPNTRHIKALSKFFGYFDIDTKDVFTIRQLEYLLGRVSRLNISDKVASKHLIAIFEGLEISKSIPALNEEQKEEIRLRLSEASDEAIDTLIEDYGMTSSESIQNVSSKSQAGKNNSKAKKASAPLPLKSSKKLFSTKARRGNIIDSDEDEDDHYESAEDDEEEIQEVKISSKAKKSAVSSQAAKKSSSNTSSSDLEFEKSNAKSAKSKTSSASSSASSKAPSVARSLYADLEEVEDDDNQVEESEGEQSEIEEEEISAPVVRGRGRPAKSTSTTSVAAKKTAKKAATSAVAKKNAANAKKRKADEMSASSGSDESDSSDSEAESSNIEVAAMRRSGKKVTTAKAAAAALARQSKKSIDLVLTDEEKENTDNAPSDAITRTGSSLSGKLSSIRISGAKGQATSSNRMEVESNEDEAYESEEDEVEMPAKKTSRAKRSATTKDLSDSELSEEDEDDVAPAKRAKRASAPKRSTSTTKMTTAKATAKAKTTARAKSAAARSKTAVQSKLMEEMSAMLD